MSAARYFAVPDPLNPGAMSYWYVRSTRGQARLDDWPPGACSWGVGSSAEQVGAALEEIQSAIHADPNTAGHRFAEQHGLCFSCGLPLTDEHSRAYGLGPECRRKFSEPEIARLSALGTRLRVEGATE